MKPAYWITLMLLAACAAAAVLVDGDKPHHTPQGFRNNYISELNNGQGNFWQWQYQRWRDGLPKPPKNGYQFAQVRPDVDRLKANLSTNSATWIGHATVLMQVAGVNILTDPHLTERASPVSFAGPKRVVPPALSFEQLPHIDMVVISHNHYDHLDRGTVLRLSQQAGGSPRFFVPLGNQAWFAELGIDNVVEMDWWDKADFKGLEVRMTPVQHWSARGLTDRFKTLWGGWHVGTGAGALAAGHAPFRFFFGGDTGYSRDFADIAARLGPVDLAILPIGAYEPRWFMASQHVDPGEAIRIHQDLQARQSLGVHWGTFELTDEPLDEPPEKLAAEMRRLALPPEQFQAVKHGETLWLR
ncbi:MAG: hypothetical protein RLZZ401_1786 [Pseudomonadota bacterium]